MYKMLEFGFSPRVGSLASTLISKRCLRQKFSVYIPGHKDTQYLRSVVDDLILMLSFFQPQPMNTM